MRNGRQTIATGGLTPPLGPFGGLNSGYEAEWYGPFVGLDVGMRFAHRHSLRMRGQYHWTSYDGTGNWNLRTDFRYPNSFEHETDATGYLLSLLYSYAVSENVSLSLEGSYKQFTADAGVDTVFYSNGDVASTRLNEVNWDSSQVRLGMDYRF